VGRNRPAEDMPFDGLVRRYLITYNVNLLPLTNDCQQRGSTDYALGVAHNTSGKRHVEPTIGWLRVLRSLDSKMSVIVAALTLASYVQIPFTFTHDSRVMSTICHPKNLNPVCKQLSCSVCHRNQ